MEKEETGDLNTSSLKSVRTALTGVIGEAIDIGSHRSDKLYRRQVLGHI